MPPVTLPRPTADLAQAMLGIWLLRSREDYDTQGTKHIDPVLGANPLGVVSFAPGHFAAQFMSRDRTTAGVQGAGANNSSGVNGYDGYFGTYSLDPAAGTIVTRLEAAVSPLDVGKVFTRAIRVIDDQLTIQLATTTPHGIAVTRTLVFARAGSIP
jgi:hypothetical protein